MKNCLSPNSVKVVMISKKNKSLLLRLQNYHIPFTIIENSNDKLMMNCLVKALWARHFTNFNASVPWPAMFKLFAFSVNIAGIFLLVAIKIIPIFWIIRGRDNTYVLQLVQYFLNCLCNPDKICYLLIESSSSFKIVSHKGKYPYSEKPYNSLNRFGVRVLAIFRLFFYLKFWNNSCVTFLVPNFISSNFARK